MGIRDVLFGAKTSTLRVPSEFDVKLERQTSSKEKIVFDARVKGYFVAKGGKPDFVAEIVHINGMPEMNIRQLLPGDLPTVKKYAISVEYPKALARKVHSR
jgi:hypothetical protein